MTSILFLISILLAPSLLLAGNLEYNLSTALSQRDLSYFKALIAKGADVNQKQPPFKQTPIIVAPLHGLAFIKVLIENGADINAKDQDNNTALINACLYGNLPAAQYLISQGADINVINNDDLTVPEAARLSKNNALIKFIKNTMKD